MGIIELEDYGNFPKGAFISESDLDEALFDLISATPELLLFNDNIFNYIVERLFDGDLPDDVCLEKELKENPQLILDDGELYYYVREVFGDDIIFKLGETKYNDCSLSPIIESDYWDSIV
jgi:hypothetical protein